ncbi:hypothetical protein S40285_04441 [Stachybotrys chlorohalonatus IBT 40285]|uniref:Enoyl reductase (ER) domain-containing protein n=1 Tax=Stachybotrys chlorohalonatus (strain IBT 40285) TaxID=1283841 RepID=A0A084R1X8_STAC4|nr:hypothetical protein S40285_04441 [Stachybotrys chlorohalonata IBT 40285]
MSRTIKEALVRNIDDEKTEVSLHEVPMPTPGDNEVLIKVVVSGTNPKDWKIPYWIQDLNPSNSGDDIAGIVESVGKDVTEFKPGDRVAAFHEMTKPHGSFAEYAIAHPHTTFHLPPTTSFEEAATIPLAAMTAVIGLYARLGLPEPWRKSHPNPDAANGVIIYGGATAVGGFALKLLKKVDFHPIYVVAGRGADFAKGLIDPSRGDKIFDYRDGDDALVQQLKEALGDKKPKLALDAVSEKGSFNNIFKVLDPQGHVATVLPTKDHQDKPDSLKVTFTMVGDAHGAERELATAWYKLFGLGLREGWFSGHPAEVVPGGLTGLDKALNDLRHGKASAVKYVVRIAETPGL